MRFNGHIVAYFDHEVKSLMSLCQIEGYPPFGHDKVCSTVKGDPQAHAEGVLCNGQPYRNARAYLYVRRNQIPQPAAPSTSPSPARGPWPFGDPAEVRTSLGRQWWSI